ncbi:MAG: inorganic diphosphatase [Ginsengibacter sp.]
MKLPSTFTKDKNCIHAIIETPKGCAAKYDYNEETQMFKLKKLLPKGMVFPFHFGFIPHTKAEDGDPLDVLVLLDELSWPGCIIECKIIGVMEATETENNKTNRNDRLIASAIASEKYNKIKDLSTMDNYLEKEIENFFNTYNNLEKKEFKIISKKGPKVALNLIKKQIINGHNQ